MKKCFHWRVKVSFHFCLLFVLLTCSLNIDMMESFFGTALSASQTPNIERSHTADVPLNFRAQLLPLVAPANVFEGELNLGSSVVAGPSLGGLRGQSVSKKTMAPNGGRMMARPSPNVA